MTPLEISNYVEQEMINFAKKVTPIIVVSHENKKVSVSEIAVPYPKMILLNYETFYKMLGSISSRGRISDIESKLIHGDGKILGGLVCRVSPLDINADVPSISIVWDL